MKSVSGGKSAVGHAAACAGIAACAASWMCIPLFYGSESMFILITYDVSTADDFIVRNRSAHENAGGFEPVFASFLLICRRIHRDKKRMIVKSAACAACLSALYIADLLSPSAGRACFKI